MRKRVENAGSDIITDYLNGFQYKDGLLQFFPHAEGYVNNTVVDGNNNYNYVFNYTDHLGNVRLSYTNSVNGLEILEENNYYPFGLKHANYNMDQKNYQEMTSGEIKPVAVTSIPYNYKYNGKELQDELGLNMYDLGARNYDPALGRFFSTDPKAEKYMHQSTFAISVNNPVFFVDINGEGVETDYKVLKSGEDEGKIVRADPNDGSEKNTTDRILKTDDEDNVKKDSDGNAKVAVDNIKKGIIKEGMNMRTQNHSIKFGGANQPTRDDLVDFLVQFSQEISGTEIAGFEAISKEGQNLIMTHKYENNTFIHSDSFSYGFDNLIRGGSIYIKAHFHTHPNNHGYETDIDKPSEDDERDQKTRNGNGEKGNNGVSKTLPHYIYNIHGRISY